MSGENQDHIGQSFGQPDVVEDDTAHFREGWTFREGSHLKVPSNLKQSMFLWLYSMKIW